MNTPRSAGLAAALLFFGCSDSKEGGRHPPDADAGGFPVSDAEAETDGTDTGDVDGGALEPDVLVVGDTPAPDAEPDGGSPGCDGVVCPPAGNPCLSSLECDPATGKCTVEVPEPASTACDVDDDLCTLDVCDGKGGCIATGQKETCAGESAADPCWAWICATKAGCTKTSFIEGASCNDANPCSFNDTCHVDGTQKVCVGTPVAVDDGNPCTDDACDAGEVVHTPLDGASCELSGGCTSFGECEDGTCVQAEPCPEGCTSDGECGEDDGDLCNGSLVCDTSGPVGVCEVDLDSVVVCPAPDAACLEAACDPITGDCLVSPVENGTPCAADDLCAETAFCQGGDCVADATKSCDDGDPCTDDVCNGGICFHPTEADDTPCGGGKTCQSGVCLDPEDPCLVWSAGEDPPSDLHYGPGAAVLGTDVHLLGGSPSFQHLVYHATTDSWESGPQLPGNGVNEGKAVVLAGKIYTIHNAFDDEVRIFDPGKSEWSLGAARPVAGFGRGPGAGTDSTGVYAFGGANGNLHGTNLAHRYDPGDDAWTEVAPLPTKRGFVASAQIGPLVYLAGGRADQDPDQMKSALEVYDTSKDAWSTKPPLPQPRSSAMGLALSGKFVVAGGFTGSDKTPTVFVYHPDAGEWTTCDPLTHPRMDGAAATVGSALLVFGGGEGVAPGTMEIGLGL